LPITGSVEKGAVPIYTSIFVKLPWLALNSRALFSGNYSEASVLPPWADPYREAEAFIYKTEISLLNQANSLPRAVKWTVGKNRKSNAGKNDLLGIEPDSTRSRFAANIEGYKDGAVRGVYEVIAETNFATKTYPKDFRLVRYQTDAKVLETINGTVTNISSFEATQSFAIPPIPLYGIGVTDYRIRSKSIDNVRYVITNAWIQSADNPKLLELAATRVASSMSPYGVAATRSQKRIGVATIAAFALVTGACLLMAMRKKTRSAIK